MAETFVHNPTAERFEAWVDGEFVGELVYRRTGSTLVFESTHINTGTLVVGLGSRLVGYAFGRVREQGDLRVRADCPYVRSWIARHGGVADLLVEPSLG